LLSRVDLVCLSDEDIGEDRSSLEHLRRHVAVVALTHGKAGCHVFEGEDCLFVPALPAHSVDPTGAGDTFAAAMSLAKAAGYHTLDAARLGSAAASVVVEGLGASPLEQLSTRIALRWHCL
jgi:ribokinase